MNPRLQGDLGERAAVVWMLNQGWYVAYPFGHSSDWDLAVDMGSGPIRKVQVKTSTVFRNRRWDVAVCTRGGNQSWNGVVKFLDPTRYDYLFVLVGDGRQWFIPSNRIDGGSKVALGGPKYAAFEVAGGAPLQSNAARGDARVVKGNRL